MGASKAVVFAGQGAQFVGMGRDLAEAYPACRALFDRADEVLGFPLSKICFEGPDEELTRSDHCQPAIFVASMACYTALQEQTGGIAFPASAGLSLGEWTALHAAGSISFDNTLRVLEARGRFMQETCRERQGGMVSVIGLDRDKLEEICAAADVEMANMNSPAQTVLSGEAAGIAKAEQLAMDAGAKKAIVLNVAGAFHSRLMNHAAERLTAVLESVEITTPAMPVVANVTGAPHGSPDEIRAAMLKQITSSVHWYECVEWLRDNGAGTIVECGPGKVLSGLIKRIDRNIGTLNVQDCDSLDAAVSELTKESNDGNA